MKVSEVKGEELVTTFQIGDWVHTQTGLRGQVVEPNRTIVGVNLQLGKQEAVIYYHQSQLLKLPSTITTTLCCANAFVLPVLADQTGL